MSHSPPTDRCFALNHGIGDWTHGLYSFQMFFWYARRDAEEPVVFGRSGSMQYKYVGKSHPISHFLTSWSTVALWCHYGDVNLTHNVYISVIHSGWCPMELWCVIESAFSHKSYFPLYMNTESYLLVLSAHNAHPQLEYTIYMCIWCLPRLKVTASWLVSSLSPLPPQIAPVRRLTWCVHLDTWHLCSLVYLRCFRSVAKALISVICGSGERFIPS